MPERDPAGLDEIAARVRVGERLVRPAVPLAPARRARQVHGEQLRMVALELAPEEIAEQVVVAVPLAAIVERDDERVRACEGVERIGCAARGEHRIAQGRRHPVEDRRREQEPLELVRLVLQHLFHEVVGDLLLIAGQPGSPRGGIVTATQRQRRQRDPGSPAFRPLAQRFGGLVRQLESPARSDFAGLVRVEREGCGPDLEQIPACTQAGERHSRIAARHQHQLRAGSEPGR